jgi:hypothetical protein
MSKFNFSNVVVVEGNLVGIIVKCWGASPTGTKRPAHYEVYVRAYNGIHEYDEDKIEPFIYDKVLEDEDDE